MQTALHNLTVAEQLAVRRNDQSRILLEDRAELVAAFRQNGVERIEAGYDGYADEANIGGIELFPKGATLPEEIESGLDYFIWEMIDHLNPDFEDGDGGFGTFKWDVASDTINVEHAKNVVTHEYSTHSDV